MKLLSFIVPALALLLLGAASSEASLKIYSVQKGQRIDHAWLPPEGGRFKMEVALEDLLAVSYPLPNWTAMVPDGSARESRATIRVQVDLMDAVTRNSRLRAQALWPGRSETAQIGVAWIHGGACTGLVLKPAGSLPGTVAFLSIPANQLPGYPVLLLWDENQFVAPVAESGYERWLAVAQAMALDSVEQLNACDAGGLQLAAKDPQQRSLIHYAVNFNATRCLDYLLSRKAPLENGNKARESVMSLAARLGRAEMAERLLANGADLAGLKSESLSPLCAAAKAGRDGMVDLLLRAEGKGVGKKEGEHALELAFDGMYPAVVKVLMARGYRIDVSNRKVAFLSACSRGMDRLVALYLEAGMSPNCEMSGRHALHEAVIRGSVDTVKVLLAAGAETKQRDGKGLLPAELAFRKGSLELRALFADPSQGAVTVPPAEAKEPELSLSMVDVMPRLIHGAFPKPTKEMRKKKITGEVMVSFILDEEGVPQEVRAVRASRDELVEVSEQAVRQWRFKPALRNGVPVRLRMQMLVPIRY